MLSRRLRTVISSVAVAACAAALTLGMAAPAQAAEAATIVYSNANKVTVYNVVDPADKTTVSAPSGTTVWDVRINDTATQIAYYYRGTNDATNAVAIRSVSGELVRTIKLGEYENFIDYYSDAGRKDARVLVSGSDGYAEYDVNTGKRTARPAPKTGFAAGYSPDGKELIGGEDGAIVAFNRTTGAKTRVIRKASSGDEGVVDRISNNGWITYLHHNGECDTPMTSRRMKLDGTGDTAFRNSTKAHNGVYASAGQSVLIYEQDSEAMTVGCMGGGGPAPRNLIGVIGSDDPKVLVKASSWDIS